MKPTSRLSPHHSGWTLGSLLIVLSGCLVASAVVVLGIGSVHIRPSDVVQVVARRLGLIHGARVSLLHDQIVWQLRAPRVLAAMAVGASLAMCGAVLQTLTGNELADPYLLGISSGASVGAVLVIILGWGVGLFGGTTITIAAFVGAMVALVAVLAMATGRNGELPSGRTILSGVAVGQLCGAITSLVLMVFSSNDGLRLAMTWTLGSFAGARWLGAGLLAGVALVMVIACWPLASWLDAFAFGDVMAGSLGIPVTKLRWILMTGTAFITAATVCVVGPIGFVGLTVPHIVRLLTGPRHATLLPFTAVAGALLMLWADTAARSLAPGIEIPVGVVTALVGAPILVILLRRQARA